MSYSILSSTTPLSAPMMMRFKHMSYITTVAGIIITVWYNTYTKQLIIIMNNNVWFVKPTATIKATLAELMGVENVQIKIDQIDVAVPTGFPYLNTEEWAIYDRTWAYYAERNYIINFNVSLREPEQPAPIEPLAKVFDRIARKLTLPYLGTIAEEKILEESKETDEWFERMHDNMHHAELLRTWN